MAGNFEELSDLAAQLDYKYTLERAGILLIGRLIRHGGRRSVIMCLAKDDPELLGRTVAQDLNPGGVARLGLCHREHQSAGVSHLLAVESRNDISGLQPGHLGGSVRRHTAYQHTGGAANVKLFGELRRQVLGLDPEIAPAHVPIFHQVGQNSGGNVRGNGKADALVSPRSC